MSDQPNEAARSKPKMPAVLKDLGRRAGKRLERRDATPEVEVGRNEDGWTFTSPYSEEDLEEWEALLFEAFATRSVAAFHAFTKELSALSPTVWKGDHSMPDEWELRAAIQIVRSVRPHNEAEACLAAQMVAVHRMQMKLSARVLGQSWPEPRTCAIAGKLARTYAMQLETMAKLRGKGTRQRITVRKYSQHEHKHIHLHQGASENGNQPHEPRRTRQAEIKAPLDLERGTSVPSDNTSPDAVPVSCPEGQEAMPSARGRPRVRRS